MSELGDKLREEVQRIIDEPMPEPPSEPIRLESEGVFNPDLLGRPDPEFLNEMEEFLDNPMGAIMKPLLQYLEACRPKPFEPIKSEHKVRIFRLHELMAPAEIESVERAIEALLNEGYCSHIPTVCNDYLIMDFSRRKETEENEREQ